MFLEHIKNKNDRGKIMDREELYNLIESEINNIFLNYQISNKIKSGDIMPMQLLRLEELQNNC